MATINLEHAIELSHEALASILKGDRSGYKALFSHEDDVTLGNPFGPYARGRKNVEATLDGAASHYRDGKVTGADLIASYASADLCCVVDAAIMTASAISSFACPDISRARMRATRVRPGCPCRHCGSRRFNPRARTGRDRHSAAPTSALGRGARNHPRAHLDCTHGHDAEIRI